MRSNNIYAKTIYIYYLGRYLDYCSKSNTINKYSTLIVERLHVTEAQNNNLRVSFIQQSHM